MKNLFFVCLVIFGPTVGYSKDLNMPKQKNSFFFGIRFLDCDFVGSEDVNLTWLTNAGIGYSYNGGFIDTTHIGGGVFWTQYLQQEIYDEMSDLDKSFSVKTKKPNLEFHINVIFPQNPCEEDLKKISIDLAAHITYCWAFIHESMSWYGYKSTGIFSEFESAFSPEDFYCDVLGINIAMEALKSNKDFDSASLSLLKKWMEDLELLDSSKVDLALEGSIKAGLWNGKRWPSNRVLLRDFDAGLKDGIIKPNLLNGVFEKEGCPINLFIPKIPLMEGYSIRVEIEPQESQGKILLESCNKNKKDKLVFEDFALIIKAIEKDAIEKLKP